MKALVVDHIHQAGINILNKYCDEVTIDIGLTSEEFAEKIKDYDIVIGRATHHTPRIEYPILEKAGQLKVIGIASVGLDRFDVEYATRKGVKLFNLPGVNAQSVAEHAFAMLLAMLRRIPLSYEHMKTGRWNNQGYTSAGELNGKTIGIIGLGDIGKKTCRIAKYGFQMNCFAYDPYITDEQADTVGAELVELEELLEVSDFIVIHAPLTKETYHMIGAKELGAMKSGVYLLNLGRGGIIDEEALLVAMTDGHVAAAALDVTEKEPLTESPLLSLPNFLCTPHIGGLTEDALRRAGIRVAIEALDAVGVKCIEKVEN